MNYWDDCIHHVNSYYTIDGNVTSYDTNPSITHYYNYQTPAVCIYSLQSGGYFYEGDQNMQLYYSVTGLANGTYQAILNGKLVDSGSWFINQEFYINIGNLNLVEGFWTLQIFISNSFGTANWNETITIWPAKTTSTTPSLTTSSPTVTTISSKSSQSNTSQNTITPTPGFEFLFVFLKNHKFKFRKNNLPFIFYIMTFLVTPLLFDY